MRPQSLNLAFFLGLAAVLLLAASGCGAGISREVMDQVDQGVTFRQVLGNPELYQGRMVVFSGTIL
ncbi:MAG: hypothetical protein AB1896_23020, partial [Thermodesulfobacteriota bacterium]